MKPLAGLIHLVVLVIFPGAGCAGVYPTPDKPPDIPPDTTLISNLRCEVFCSETRLRTGGMELSWSTDALHLRGDRQRLDVTIFKTGFEDNRYTSLLPIERGQPFRALDPVNPSDLPATQAMYMSVEEVNADTARGFIMVKLEGSEPSLSYAWRVLVQDRNTWLPGGVVRCRAPICPADMQDTNQR